MSRTAGWWSAPATCSLPSAAIERSYPEESTMRGMIRVLACWAVLLALGVAAPAKPPKKPDEPANKRPAPRAVPPVLVDGVIYKTQHARLGGGGPPVGFRAYVIATEDATGKELWKLLVYEILFQPKMATDVQEVYVTALKNTAEGLVVECEDGGKYLIDLKARKVQRK